MLLHGFAAHSGYWAPVKERLASDRHVVAYDLPGHGESDTAGDGGTRAMAEAVGADLRARFDGPVDLAGHSMGGAIACLIALENPSLVHSLTLLAPGGFGPEINARLIKRFAAARRREEIEPLYEQFYGWRRAMAETAIAELVEQRRRDGACAYFEQLAERLFGNDVQREIDREAVAALGMPVKAIWGTQDRITPTRQAHKLPGEIAVHVFDGVGHSIADEIPDQVARLVRENSR